MQVSDKIRNYVYKCQCNANLIQFYFPTVDDFGQSSENANEEKQLYHFHLTLHLMCKKNSYFCILTWFCLLFLSLFVAGIIICVMPTEYHYPIYQQHNGYFTYHMDSRDVYQSLGLVQPFVSLAFSAFSSQQLLRILKKNTVISETEPLFPKQVVGTHSQMNSQQMQSQHQQYQMIQPVKFVQPNEM
ncbi:Hypothetical_protein [Hexamita inflata]|uniref:Hypothetical_protein n=1 Tax=Hexamita inflata TaxID=28002 RepID=A0AA86N9K4_9EUKA|nr:Hypothetical protein HINF_LOCUS3234 [Hexamita inflata]